MAPPAPPPRDARRLGPQRYDMSRELRPKGTAYVGATPVADHPVEPFGIVTNLNQDLTPRGRRGGKWSKIEKTAVACAEVSLRLRGDLAWFRGTWHKRLVPDA